MAETFPISGNIDPATFPFLLMDLHRRGATGSLKVEGPSHPKALYFRGGRVLFGSSNDPKDQLGSILIEQGKITQEQLDEANTKVGPGNPLAKVLAESGIVNQRELGDAARIKVERILSDLITYSSGSFEFEDGVLPKGAVDLKLSTERLLLAAVSRIGDRAFVLRHLDGLGVVLAPAPDSQERAGEVRAEVAPLLDHLDGQRSLKEAAALARLDEFEAAKLACGLLFLGMIWKGEPGRRGASDELDLAATARLALGEDVEAPALGSAPVAASASPPTAPESPFFVPDEELRLGEPKAPAAAAEVAIPASDPAPGLFATSVSEPEPAIAAAPEAPAFAETGGSPESPAEPAAGSFETAPATPAFEVPPPFEPPPPMPPFEPPNFTPPAPGAETSPPPPSSGTATAPAGGAAPAWMPAPSRDAVPSFDVPTMPSLDEREDEAAAVAPSRPSREDLAALDALLNPGASAIGVARPAERPRGETWQPQFRPTPRRPAPRRHGLPLVPVALGLAGLAGVAAAGYYFLVLRPAKADQVASRPASPGPRPTAPAASVAPTVAPTLEATLPPATVAAAPPTTRPPATPPTSAPRAPVASAAGGEARGLLQGGAYASAALSFASELSGSARGRYSVQILVACSEETIQKALAAVPSEELFILPVTYQGRSCYRVCWGVYGSEAQAASASRAMPDYFRRGGASPRVSPLTALLP